MNKKICILIVLISVAFCFAETFSINLGKDSMFVLTKYGVEVHHSSGGSIENLYYNEHYYLEKYFWVDTLIESISIKVVNLDPAMPYSGWRERNYLDIVFKENIRSMFETEFKHNRSKPLIIMNGSISSLSITEESVKYSVKRTDSILINKLKSIKSININNTNLVAQIDKCTKFLESIKIDSNTTLFSYYNDFIKAFPEALNDKDYQRDIRIFEEGFILDTAKIAFEESDYNKAKLYAEKIELSRGTIKAEANEVYLSSMFKLGEFKNVFAEIIIEYENGEFVNPGKNDLLINCVIEKPRRIKKVLKIRNDNTDKSIFTYILKALITQKENNNKVIKYLKQSKDSEIKKLLLAK